MGDYFKFIKIAGFKLDNHLMNIANEEPPLVSVFMVTYNHEKYIRQCLQSVIDQKTKFKIEVVIGEDCSTDGTRLILKEFKEKYPEIIKPIYHDVNVGPSLNAYEFVFPNLKGKYVACLEGDDYWTDVYKLQKQVDFLEENAGYKIAASQSLIEIDGKIISNTNTFTNDTFTLEDLLIKSRFETASFIFRNEPIIIIPDWFITYGTDVDALVFWILKDGHKAYVMKEVMSVYRYHAGGATKQKNYQQKVDYYIGMLDRFNQSTNGKFDRSIKAKKLSVYTQFNLFILSYPKRISFILKNTFNYLRFPGNGSLTVKLLVKYFLPHTFRKV